MIPKILPWIQGKGTIYIEPYGGAAYILGAKRPHPFEVYNDANQGLCHFFRTIQDPASAKELIRLARLTPHSRYLYLEARQTWDDEEDAIQRALKWYIVAGQSFSGKWGQSWGYGTTGDTATKHWGAQIERIHAFAERLRSVQIEWGDALAIIPVYDHPDAIFYCDPPYVLEARADQSRGYEHEVALDHHEALVQQLLSLKGQAVVSGYEHPVYDLLIAAGWRLERHRQQGGAGFHTRENGVKGVGSQSGEAFYRTECLWISPGLQDGQQLQLF